MSILAVNPERVHVRGRPSIKACGKNELSTISHPHYIFSPLEERKEKKINGSFLYSKIWENGLANAFFVGYSRVFCVCFDYFFLFSFSEAFVFPSLSRIFSWVFTPSSIMQKYTDYRTAHYPFMLALASHESVTLMQFLFPCQKSQTERDNAG